MSNMIATSVRSLFEWLKEKEQIVYDNQQEPTLIEEPKFINSNKLCGSTVTRPPNSYIGLLHDVCLVGGTRLIINGNKELLYDELAPFQHTDYGIKPNLILKMTAKDQACVYPKSVFNYRLKEGIVISCDYDYNYFHWLVECLPKLVFLDSYEEFRDIPLLVRADLHPNLLAALAYINKTHPVIPVNYGCLYSMKRLIYVSELSRLLDRYYGAWNLGTDSVIGHYWLKQLIEKLKLGYQVSTPWRKLYLSRGCRPRRLLNESELETKLLERGFEIIDLFAHTFDSQLQLFSQAAIVIAPSGAALVNMLFCQKNTKIISLTHEHEGIDFHLWPQLAAVSGVSVEHFIGHRAFKLNTVHDDYSIPLDQFLDFLDRIE